MRSIKKQLVKIARGLIRPFCKPYIVFESVPDFSDNSLYVYKELKRRGYKKKYKMIWYLGNRTFAFEKNNSYEIKKLLGKSPKSLFLGMVYYVNVKALIISNRFFYSDNADVSVYLGHGTPIKNIRDYYTLPKEIDYCIAASETVREIMAYELNYDYNRIIPLGYPRNDVFSEIGMYLNNVFDSCYDKFIVWYPTFRQHKDGWGTTKDAIPLIQSVDKAIVLNECAKKRNVLIIIKPHFAQDISKIKKMDLSNILFIDDEFFVINSISSYQLLNSCDALLSDYSSVYCDFLLTGKPIGLIWEDIEEYKKNPGLYPKYEELSKGTYKIYTIDELLDFVNMVAEEKDPFKEERKDLCDSLNVSTDGKNTERVVEFIIEKAKL